MSKEIVKSIELNIADVTVKVTPKQAKALFDALSELLGDSKTTPVPVYQPYWYWNGWYPHPNSGTVFTGTVTGTATTTSGVMNLTNGTSSVTFNNNVPTTLTIQ